MNIKGPSATAASVNGTPSTVPGTPTALSVTAHPSTSISLSWSAPASTGGSDLIAYTIYYNTGGSDTQFVRTSGDELNTTEMVTGLSANTSYNFSIYAVNANGTCTTPATITQATDP